MNTSMLKNIKLPYRFQRSISITASVNKNKKKDHWHNVATKKEATDKALEHFDDFYKSIFRLRWPSVRLGLLSEPKYVAVVNNFGDVQETETLLSNLGAMNVEEIFDVWTKNLKSIANNKEKEKAISTINTLDQLLEAKVRREDEKEISFLYPDGSGDKLKGTLFSDNQTERQTNKNEDSIDNDRVIDPELSIDSASLHEFIPATKLKGMEDYLPESEYYAYYKPTSDVPVEIVSEPKLNFPEYLKVHSFDRGVFDKYPPPKRTTTGVSNYYLMNGASMLPVLALNILPGDVVLDMCASPGGKSLLILQTMYPKLLVCNDSTQSRVNRIHRMLKEFLYDYNSKWQGMLSVQQRDGSEIYEKNVYDKILVDAPCTNDRLSLIENDNNMFKQSRIKERLRLPELQSTLLCNALRLVKLGGTVVYSTCSLSPVQNDGVVGLALRRLWEEEKAEFTVKDLSPALKCTSRLFHYGQYLNLKFGTVVVPFLPSNFGPMYICKMIMGGNEIKANEHKLEPIIVDGKKLKPCCACPETKKVRDTCIIENGEANCSDLIEAHKVCMRKLGFRI